MKPTLLFILGFLTSLLFPPYFFVPLGFLIFPSICLLIENNKIILKRKTIFLYSFTYGFGFLLSLLIWMQNPFYIFEETKNLFYFSFLFIFFLAILFAVNFLIIITFFKKIPAFILVPIIFISFEFILSRLFSGFPWVTFALIISSFSETIIITKYFGSFVTSFLLIFIFCLPYVLINKILKKFEYTIILIIVFVPLFAFIINAVYNYENEDRIKKNLNLEIIQLNNKINDFENNQNKLDIIEDLITNSDAEIIVFAENNYPFLLKDISFNRIQKILGDHQTVIIGATRQEKEKYYNSLININNKNISYYDKKILVPFGEFLPFREKLKFLEKISGPNDYSEGQKKRLISISKDINYIPIICYEIIFYWKIINKLNYQSDFIINITNDFWFGRYIGPYQHFYLTKMRSSEFNKIIIRVSNNGISGIFDSNANILIKTSLNKKEIIRETISINENNINYFQLHLFSNIILLFLIITIIVFYRFQHE